MSIRPQCLKLDISYYKESAYGTQVLDANIDKKFQLLEPAILDVAQARVDDADAIKGYEFPSDVDLDIVQAQDISLPFNFACSPELAGMLYSLALGSLSTAGVADPYTHTIKPQDGCTSDSLPSSSWTVGLTGDTASYYTLKGLVIDDLKLTLDSINRLSLSGTARSDGNLVAAAAHSFASLVSVTYLKGAHGDFLSCDYGGSPASKKTVLRGFDFTINNNLDLADGRSNVVNSTKYLTALRFGQRTYTIVVRLEGHWETTASSYWADYIAETTKDITVKASTTTGGKARSVTVRAKKCKIASVKPSFDGIRDVIEVTYKVLYDSGDAAPVVVTVENAVTAYLLT